MRRSKEIVEVEQTINDANHKSDSGHCLKDDNNDRGRGETPTAVPLVLCEVYMGSRYFGSTQVTAIG
jgi:hypothetical protein